MIIHLLGACSYDEAAPTRLLLRVAGRGLTYELEVHPSIGAHTRDIDEKGIWVWQVFAEDKQTMYGFLTLGDRDLAIRLRDIQGMGPVSCARLVQSAGYQQVMSKIAAGDAKGLSTLSTGLGVKRARAIIAELQTIAQAQAGAGDAQAGRFVRLNSAISQLVGGTANQLLLGQLMKQHEELDDAGIVQLYLSKT